MTDWSRLIDYIYNYFPEPNYSSQDIREWAQKEVPAWKSMDKSDKNMIIKDWENFIAPKFESRLSKMSRGFRVRIKKFLGRLF